LRKVVVRPHRELLADVIIGRGASGGRVGE